MNRFKKGDRVTLSEEGIRCFHYQSKGFDGTILNANESGKWRYDVKWDNGNKNSYREVDLDPVLVSSKNPKKLAVHCPTKEIADQVRIKSSGKSSRLSKDNKYFPNVYLYLDYDGFDSNPVVVARNGYKIISSEEYLYTGQIVTNSNNQKEEVKMRKCVIKVFTKTEDAVVVDTWASTMGYSDTFRDELSMHRDKDVILTEAKRLEAEAQEQVNKSK